MIVALYDGREALRLLSPFQRLVINRHVSAAAAYPSSLGNCVAERLDRTSTSVVAQQLTVRSARSGSATSLKLNTNFRLDFCATLELQRYAASCSLRAIVGTLQDS